MPGDVCQPKIWCKSPSVQLLNDLQAPRTSLGEEIDSEIIIRNGLLHQTMT